MASAQLSLRIALFSCPPVPTSVAYRALSRDVLNRVAQNQTAVWNKCFPSVGYGKFRKQICYDIVSNDTVLTTRLIIYPRFISQCNDLVTGWTVRGSNSGSGMKFVSSPKSPERLCSTPCLLFSGKGSFTWESSGLVLLLSTHLHLVPRWRMSGAIPPLSYILSGSGWQNFFYIFCIEWSSVRWS